MRLTFKELKDEIAKIVPKSIDYRVDLEAGNIAIVTPVPEKFGGGDGLVGKIAKKIKRKIKIRPDPSIVKPELEAKSLIESSRLYIDNAIPEDGKLNTSCSIFSFPSSDSHLIDNFPFPGTLKSVALY